MPPIPGPFQDPIAGGLTSIVFDIAKKVGGAFLETIQDKRQAAAALKRYRDKYRDRYGTVRILGMRHSYPLEQVYTKVKLLNDISIRQFESAQTLEEQFRERGQRRFNLRERSMQDGISIVNKYQYLTVLGQPGAGKSTFLRRMGSIAFYGVHRNGFCFNCLPVFVELKKFDPQKSNLLRVVAEELSNFGFPITPEFAIKALEQGRLLILLDGRAISFSYQP